MRNEWPNKPVGERGEEVKVEPIASKPAMRFASSVDGGADEARDLVRVVVADRCLAVRQPRNLKGACARAFLPARVSIRRRGARDVLVGVLRQKELHCNLAKSYIEHLGNFPDQSELNSQMARALFARLSSFVTVRA